MRKLIALLLVALLAFPALAAVPSGIEALRGYLVTGGGDASDPDTTGFGGWTASDISGDITVISGDL
jgi:hypothetical protein